MDQGLTVDIERTCDELVVVEEVLELDGKSILELGCGRAELTRAIATQGVDRDILALEVDEVQHRLNLQIDDLPNGRFGLGGAEDIPAEDGSMDVVFMFRSLHHVPPSHMNRALVEIARVLKPGGLAYISEPIFRGPLNEVLRIFADESQVRHLAFEAVENAVKSGTFLLEREIFFRTPRDYGSFAGFEELVIGATHSSRQLTDAQRKLTQTTFQRLARRPEGDRGVAGKDSGGRSDNCGFFETPVRVDLLRRP